MRNTYKNIAYTLIVGIFIGYIAFLSYKVHIALTKIEEQNTKNEQNVQTIIKGINYLYNETKISSCIQKKFIEDPNFDLKKLTESCQNG